MEFLQPYINIWKNFAKFDGRTGVRGFWMAFVVNMIVGLQFGVIPLIIWFVRAGDPEENLYGPVPEE